MPQFGTLPSLSMGDDDDEDELDEDTDLDQRNSNVDGFDNNDNAKEGEGVIIDYEDDKSPQCDKHLSNETWLSTQSFPKAKMTPTPTLSSNPSPQVTLADFLNRISVPERELPLFGTRGLRIVRTRPMVVIQRTRRLSETAKVDHKENGLR